MNNKITILDTTLRDGSYTIGYQFSLQDNVIISSGLERAGVELIEIGHGTGLGSSRKSNTQAYSDVEYMKSVRDTIKKSSYGFFFIPGIGNSNDLKLLADNGGGFIRIGVSIENYHEAKKYIKLSKKLKLKFWINLMKSYVYTPQEFAEFAKTCFLDGAEGLYLVDSAGGMLPRDVSLYIESAKSTLEKINAKNFHLGFHGHENISMGVACALAAAESGATIVDGSLLGIGRSIGNSPIETLGIVLKKAGFSSKVDPWQLSDLADKTIRPYLENRWRHSSIEQALGFKEIHSNFLKDITAFAKQKNIHARDLILALPDDANKSVDQKMLNGARKKLQVTKKTPAKNIHSSGNALSKELALPKLKLNNYIKNLLSLSERTNRQSALLLTPNWNPSSRKKYALQKIKSSKDYAIGSIEFSSQNHCIEVDNTLLKKLDYIIYDEGISKNASLMKSINGMGKGKSFTYSDRNTVFNHIARHLSALSSRYKSTIKVFINCNNIKDKINLSTLLENNNIQNLEDPSGANVHILLSKNQKQPYKIKTYPNLSSILDVRSRILTIEDVQFSKLNNIDLVAVDFEAAIVSEVTAIITNYLNFSNQFGDLKIKGLRLVAKGKWGNNGDVIVDKVPEPTSVIGICDGLGGVKKTLSKKDNANLKKILTFIINQ